jgi:hypothetical protein
VGLFETLPAGVTFIGTSISNGGSGTCAQVVGHPNQIQCQVNDLDPGASVNVYTQVLVNASTAKNTVLTINGAASTSSNDPTADTASASSTVDTLADVGTTLTAPSHVYKPSTTETYTATVTNAGPSDAQSVVLTVTFPGTKIGHYVSNNAPAGVCVQTTKTYTTIVVTCKFGTLAAGSSVSVQIVYFIKGSPKLLTVTDAVTSTTSDPNSSNNTAMWTVGPK